MRNNSQSANLIIASKVFSSVHLFLTSKCKAGIEDSVY